MLLKPLPPCRKGWCTSFFLNQIFSAIVNTPFHSLILESRDMKCYKFKLCFSKRIRVLLDNPFAVSWTRVGHGRNVKGGGVGGRGTVTEKCGSTAANFGNGCTKTDSIGSTSCDTKRRRHRAVFSNESCKYNFNNSDIHIGSSRFISFKF